MVQKLSVKGYWMSVKYTEGDVSEVIEGKWYGNGYLIDGTGGFENKFLVVFKDGTKCNAGSVSGAVEWMNKIDVYDYKLGV